MKFYVLIDGKLARYGDCPEEWVELQAGPGEEVHTGEPPEDLLTPRQVQ